MLLGDIPRKYHLGVGWLKATAWEKLSSHDHWKKNFGPQGNTQWQGGKPKHVLNYLNLVSDIVYGTGYDAVLRNMI